MDPKPLKDSGKRRTFKSGAVRDRGDLKPRPDLISPHAQMREGMIHTLGSKKYALRNWEQGLPISECLASAQRHIEQFKRGDTDEDHVAQARWNLGAIIHFEEEIKAGRLDTSLDDMPRYAAETGVTPEVSWEPRRCPVCGKMTNRMLHPDRGELELFCLECRWCKWLPLDALRESEPSFHSVFPAETTSLEPPPTEFVVSLYPRCPKCNTQMEYIINPVSGPSIMICPKCKWTSPVCTEATDDWPPSPRECLEAEAKARGTAVGDPPTFYIAGPMRGYEFLNFPLFDKVAKIAREQGLTVISPAELDREHGIDPINDPESVDRARQDDPNLLQTIVQRDCNVLLTLDRDRGDGLILLPGWTESVGAQAEVALALWLELAFKTVYVPLKQAPIIEDFDAYSIKYKLFHQQG